MSGITQDSFNLARKVQTALENLKYGRFNPKAAEVEAEIIRKHNEALTKPLNLLTPEGLKAVGAASAAKYPPRAKKP